jgi:AcrR family transcriptional regulator
VVAAARSIVERDGIETLTMREVARELGSSPMATYRHVRDKDELLVLLLDQLAGELPRPRFSGRATQAALSGLPGDARRPGRARLGRRRTSDVDVHVNPNAKHREIWLRDLDGYLVVFAEGD